LTGEFEHVLKNWEKTYGYIGLSKEERKLFDPVAGKRFTLEILGKEYYERRIDKLGRIYVSHGALADLEIGDILTIGKDEKGKYYIRKKKS